MRCLSSRSFALPILLSVERWLGLLGISLAELDGAFAQSCRNARLAFHANEVQAKSILASALLCTRFLVARLALFDPKL